LKWAGGKRQLLPALLGAAPRRSRTYFEPFLGGAALFFALGPRRAVLADTNARLIRTYRGVRDDVDGVIALLRTYRHDPEFFYRMRAADIDRESDARVAAWFIYLNRVGYNGLYRVNRRNRFNVPFGRYVNPTICDEPRLRACAVALRHADLQVADFCDAVRGATRGDFVYFDPPYVPLTPTASFTSYTAAGFGPDDQVRLRDLARRLKRRGVHVLISNSGTDRVRELYADGFDVDEVRARRAVNSRASGRGAVAELVIR
jgi:DNA adenine methylase